MIKITLTFEALENDGVRVSVQTHPFDPHRTPQSVGLVWTAVGMAINQALRARGLPNFDCLAGRDPAPGVVRDPTPCLHLRYVDRDGLRSCHDCPFTWPVKGLS